MLVFLLTSRVANYSDGDSNNGQRVWSSNLELSLSLSLSLSLCLQISARVNSHHSFRRSFEANLIYEAFDFRNVC